MNFKIKHAICDNNGRDFYLLGVNALVLLNLPFFYTFNNEVFLNFDSFYGTELQLNEHLCGFVLHRWQAQPRKRPMTPVVSIGGESLPDLMDSQASAGQSQSASQEFTGKMVVRNF